MSPAGNDEGAARQQPRSSNTTNAATPKQQVRPQLTTDRRRDALRRALKDARRCRDAEAVALLVARLSDESAA